MTHVPDEAITAIDALGRGVLSGEPSPVSARLRSDLRLQIPIDADRLATGRTQVAYLIDHVRAEDTIREYGPYVESYVTGVDQQLTGWGLEPPSAYDFAGAREDWHLFTGTLRLI
ncbi:MAG: hypothetical protein A07HR60_00697 [uncultured archaeon A07HR60]|nr:MAG: hypothetical protein A07HR60_00697 [uncultured archaeon A07HR60]